MTGIMLRVVLAAGATLAMLAAPVGQGGAQTPISLQGAGATFPAPLYYKWMEAYAKERPGIRISYDSVGSGDGISRFMAGTVDFAASDAALSEKDAERVPRGAVLVPATGGMIALAYNLPGLGGTLRLPRAIYVDIFLGKITNWSDPRIKQANAGLTLPNRTIAVVTRLDKSGTTFAFTTHLSAVSDAWRAGPGTGTLIEWPRNAMLARGNEGVASRIKISEGAIGYVEYGFAKRLGLTIAELQNKAGAFVAPGDRSGAVGLGEAIAARDSGFQPIVADPATPDAYPIVTFSWLILYRTYADEPKRQALREFVGWGLTAGQGLGGALGFIALPESVVARGQAVLASIR
jgi:phosphate transport system substrate-binding protein